MTARNWHLSGDQINTLQDESIERLVRMCKQAHYVDVKVRINGEYQHFQADWIKHLALADALSRQPSAEAVNGLDASGSVVDASAFKGWLHNEGGAFKKGYNLGLKHAALQPSEEAVTSVPSLDGCAGL